jgi:predicted nucleic acid-binding protein
MLADTEMFVSALIKPLSAPEQVAQAHAKGGDLEIVVSTRLLDELGIVLAHPKFAADFTIAQAQALLQDSPIAPS